MAYNTCPSCRGRKVLKGLGGMEKGCINCGGVGFVAVVEPVVLEEAAIIDNNNDDVVSIDVKRKKRG